MKGDLLTPCFPVMERGRNIKVINKQNSIVFEVQ